MHISILKPLLFLIAVFLSFPSVALERSNLKFTHILQRELESIGYINDIDQDVQGYMWFGATKGLARYDGYSVTIFLHDELDDTSIDDSYVNDIEVTRNGDLLIASREGINVFDPRTEQFKTIPAKLAADVEELGEPHQLLEDAQGRLWLAATTGLYVLNSEHRYFEPVASTSHRANTVPPQVKGPESPALEREIWAIAAQRDGRLWLGHNNGIVSRYDPEKGVIDFLASENLASNKHTNNIQALLVDRLDRLWVGTLGGGLFMFDQNKQTFTQVPYSRSEKSDTVWALVEDTEGVIWIGDGSSVALYNPNTDETLGFRYVEGDLTGPGNYVVRALFLDRAGDMWLGYFPSGVDVVDNQASAFKNYRHSPFNQNTLTDGGVLSIAEDGKGNLWVGAGYGLNYFDRHNNTFTHYIHDPEDDASLSGSTILDILIDKNKTLWLGAWDRGLNRKDAGSDQFIHYLPEKGNPQSILGREPWSVIEDSRGDIWVATEQGVSRYNRETDDFTRFLPENRLEEGQTLYTRVVYEDRQNNLWIGSVNGLYLLDRDTGIFTRYGHKDGDPSTISQDFVTAIYEDSRGRFWVGTDAGGLNLMDRATGIFKRLSVESGLANQTVSGIVEDRSGFIWLTTYQGLSRLDPQTFQFRNYDKRDGLWGNLFNGNTPIMTKDGLLAVGNSKSLTLFNPDFLKENTYVPPVVLTGLDIFNKRVSVGDENSPLSQTIHTSTSLTLTHEQSVFSLTFSALNYRSPEENQYAYRLQGFDEKWNHVGNKRTATYTNLDAGEYVFEVKGSNNEGVWNETPTRITITILPPYWKTWWAYCIYFIVASLLAVWFVYTQRMKLAYEKQKLQQERQVVKKLQEVDKLKDEFFVNTSHELRTPLIGVIGLSESLIDGVSGTLPEKTIQQLKMVVSSGKRLSSLVDDILDYSKLKHRGITLNKRPVDLSVLVDVVITLSWPLVDRTAVTLINDIPDDMPTVIADEDRLMQIFHNLVGNAIKFTDKGSITIGATHNDNEVEVYVADTGVGIPDGEFNNIFKSFLQLEASATRQYGGTGLGLSITKQLVELHQGKISVDSQEGVGSTFTFTLPLSVADKDEMQSLPGTRLEKDLDPMEAVQQLAEKESADPSVDWGDNLVYGGCGSSILVVDDEPVNRKVLANYLTLRNYNVYEAGSGTDAINMIAAHKEIGLVLLDIMMPRISGYDVCRELREIYAPHELPIILLTSGGQMSSLVMGFELGANDFLTKPVAKEELLARVNTHLQLRDINRNLDKKVADRTEQLSIEHSRLKAAQDSLRKANKKLQDATLTDPLTNLRNRRFLDHFIQDDISIVEREFIRWLRSDDAVAPLEKDIVFYLMDIDDFKGVNDHYGHNAGDMVLQQLGVILSDIGRASDYVIRWGGEEFLIVSRFSDRQNAHELAERIRQTIEAHAFDIGNEKYIKRTCSIGFAAFPFYPGNPSVLGWEQTINSADRALLSAKRSGKNCWVGLVAADDNLDGKKDPSQANDLSELISGGYIRAISSRESNLLVWE